MRIAFIGGGFMGEAIIGALLKDGFAEAGHVTVSDVAAARRDHLSGTYGVAVTDDNAVAIKDAELIVLAVKPQEFANIAEGLKGRLAGGQTVLSIMAGVPLAKIIDGLAHKAVVRVMPNTAASVGEAISFWIASEAVSEETRAAVSRMLQTLGREVQVTDEKYMDMATAVSGSGPGFIFLVLEALIDGAVHIGLRRDQAEQLATQTLFGSAVLARELGKHPAELRNMVTSPGGTTAAGLQVLEDAGIRGAIIDAVEAAFERAKELSG